MPETGYVVLVKGVSTCIFMDYDKAQEFCTTVNNARQEWKILYHREYLKVSSQRIITMGEDYNKVVADILSQIGEEPYTDEIPTGWLTFKKLNIKE